MWNWGNQTSNACWRLSKQGKSLTLLGGPVLPLTSVFLFFFHSWLRRSTSVVYSTDCVFCFFRSDNLCFGLFIQGHDCVPYSYPLSPTLGLTNPMFLPRYWVVLVWQGGRTHYDSTENIQTLRCSVLQWKLVSLKRTPVDRIFFTPVVYAHRCVCISALPPVSVRFHDCVIKTLWLFTHTMMIYRLLTNTHIQCVRECTCNIQVYYHIE